MSDYKHPEVLVTTEWAAEHLNDPKVRFVEVDVDTSAYDQGHIAGAVGWNWQTQLQDNVRRDLIKKNELEKLLSDSGISNDATIILYGDNNNWFAAYAFWQLKLNGHNDVRLLNGGRKKWAEEKRELNTAPAKVTPASYKVAGTDESIRAKRDTEFAHLVRVEVSTRVRKCAQLRRFVDRMGQSDRCADRESDGRNGVRRRHAIKRFPPFREFL